jgi:hypothetical protein
MERIETPEALLRRLIAQDAELAFAIETIPAAWETAILAIKERAEQWNAE